MDLNKLIAMLKLILPEELRDKPVWHIQLTLMGENCDSLLKTISIKDVEGLGLFITNGANDAFNKKV